VLFTSRAQQQSEAYHQLSTIWPDWRLSYTPVCASDFKKPAHPENGIIIGQRAGQYLEEPKYPIPPSDRV
jgi:hypothetical protein